MPEPKSADADTADTGPASVAPVLPPGVWTLAEIDAGSGGLEVDTEGRIYMGDFGVDLAGAAPGERVYRITPEGEVETFADGLYGASGNAFDADGHLLQSNIAAGSISRIGPGGQVAGFASGLSAPVGLAVHPDGDVFVANCGDASIGRVAPDGTVTTHAASPLLACPNGLTLADGVVEHTAGSSEIGPVLILGLTL